MLYLPPRCCTFFLLRVPHTCAVTVAALYKHEYVAADTVGSYVYTVAVVGRFAVQRIFGPAFVAHGARLAAAVVAAVLVVRALFPIDLAKYSMISPPGSCWHLSNDTATAQCFLGTAGARAANSSFGAFARDARPARVAVSSTPARRRLSTLDHAWYATSARRIVRRTLHLRPRAAPPGRLLCGSAYELK